MLTPIAAVIREHSQPLAPIGTGMAAELHHLPEVRGVLFDIYGTLFISGSGDIGLTAQDRRAEAVRDALAGVGMSLRDPEAAGAVADCLVAEIAAVHTAARAAGVDYPEVDLVAVWRATLGTCAALGYLAGDPAAVDLPRLAVEYEVRVNPVWPMPGAQATLAALQSRGLPVGLVSNAQFFTRALFPAFWGGGQGLDVDPDLMFLSYEYGWAKPSTFLFERAADACRSRGLAPRDVLYIGNDLLNDVWPATRVGFRTGLFAGDARSLRARAGDPRVAGLAPDIVLTELRQLLSCLDGVESQPNG